MVGIGKDDKPLSEDARPLVVGETWRRLAAKVALRGEKLQDPETDLAGFLQPNQCAIGVKAGAEIIIHTLRQWCERHKNNTEMAALKKDKENAFNAADEHEFLHACHEHLPGCAELAEWCYGDPVNLVYHGRLVTSYKGQQGCPLMMPMYCVMQQKLRQLTPSASRLSIKADYADDGIDGGSLKNRWNTLQEEIALADRFGTKFNYDKMKLYLLAGDFFNSDNSSTDEKFRENMDMLANFRGLGIEIDYSQNISFMKVPIMGSQEFIDEFIQKKLHELTKTLDVLVELPNPHVAHYLLRQAAGVCKVQYFMRTTPVDMIRALFEGFDQTQKQVFEQLVGMELDETQWTQAQLPIKLGGCGVRSAIEGADAAYIMSRAMTLEPCQKVDRRYISEGDTEDEIFVALGGAVRRVNMKLPPEQQLGDVGSMSCEISDIKKKYLLLNRWVEDETAKRLHDNAMQWDKARLNSVKAPRAGAWLYKWHSKQYW